MVHLLLGRFEINFKRKEKDMENKKLTRKEMKRLNRNFRIKYFKSALISLLKADFYGFQFDIKTACMKLSASDN
jgi:hypothetical protein